MDLTRIMSRQEASLKQAVQDYLTKITAELNFRLLCEATDSCQEAVEQLSIQAKGKKYQAELLLPPTQMLWIESITVTDSVTTPPHKRQKAR